MKWSHTQTIKEDDLPPSSVTIPYRGAGRMNYDLQILYLSHNHLCFLTGKRKRLKAEMFCRTILKWLCREAMCLGHGGTLWRLWIRGIQVMGEQNSPYFWSGLVQAPWALLTKCPLCLAGVGAGSPFLREGKCHQSCCVCVASLVIHIVGQSSDTEQLPEPLLPLWYIGIRCRGWLLSVSGCCVPQPVRGGISSLVAPGISTELWGAVFATWVLVPIS